MEVREEVTDHEEEGVRGFREEEGDQREEDPAEHEAQGARDEDLRKLQYHSIYHKREKFRKL